jgi:phage terminase small subunit
VTDANPPSAPQSASGVDGQPKGLSDRQQRFCAEYLVDCNATQAAIRAGYSAASAKQQGSRLLARPDVQARLAGARTQLLDGAGVKAEDVVARLKRIAWSQPGDDWRAGDILKALELLGKHLGMWTEDAADRGPTLAELVDAAMRLTPEEAGDPPALKPPEPPPASPPASAATVVYGVEGRPPEEAPAATARPERQAAYEPPWQKN